ncbi:MAG: folate-binding protein [Pseudomonadota bacterium]
MTGKCIHLEGRAVLALTGEDRLNFLEGLITRGIKHIGQDAWVYAGLLTPQGKYLHDFFLREESETLLLDCAESQAATLTRKLMMYRLRSKVDIAQTDRQVFAHLGVEDGPHVDPRLAAMGARSLDGDPTGTMADYNAHRLRLGVPDGPDDFLQDKTLWLETNADVLGGVDFDKGCYVGQEITARMRYRGKVRRRLIPIKATQPIPAHTPIHLGERQVGDTRSTIETTDGALGLANLRVEDLEKGPLRAGDVELSPWVPDWLAPAITPDESAAHGT